MNFMTSKNSFNNLCSKHLNKATFLAWAIFAIYLIIVVMARKSPHDCTITWMYWNASLNWIKGLQMYNANDSYCAFVYFPHSAILQVPFAILPYKLADIIWRILNVSLLTLSCYLLAKIWKKYLPPSFCFFVISLIAIPVSHDALRNGQINIILTTLCCLATVLLLDERYKTAILLCFLGVALKPYMIIPLLLILGIYPWRLFKIAIICTFVFIIFPFLFQAPQYVLQEYKSCLLAFQTQNLKGLEIGYTNLFGLRQLFDLTISQTAVTVISATFGIITYIISLLYLKRNKNYIGPFIMIFFAVCYVLLFGPKTEFNTYCMVAPFMGFLILGGILYKKWSYIAVSIICWITVFSANALHKVITPNVEGGNSWPAPLALVIFLILTLIFVLPELMRTFQSEEPHIQNP